jgi:uncharacterized membrane protein
VNKDTAIPFSSVDALRFGWKKTTENLKPLLIIGAVGAFLMLLNQALTGSGDRSWIAPLLGLAVQVLQAAVILAYVRVALRLHDGQPVSVSRPADLLANFLTFLLTLLLYTLIVAAGLVLLIVPGVIWGLKFAYAPFLVVDKKLDPVDALRESSRLTQGVKGQLLAFALLMWAVNLVGAIALGVGLLLTVPTTYIASAYVLRRLQQRAGERSQASAQIPPLAAPPPASASTR